MRNVTQAVRRRLRELARWDVVDWAKRSDRYVLYVMRGEQRYCRGFLSWRDDYDDFGIAERSTDCAAAADIGGRLCAM